MVAAVEIVELADSFVLYAAVSGDVIIREVDYGDVQFVQHILIERGPGAHEYYGWVWGRAGGWIFDGGGEAYCFAVAETGYDYVVVIERVGDELGLWRLWTIDVFLDEFAYLRSASGPLVGAGHVCTIVEGERVGEFGY